MVVSFELSLCRVFSSIISRISSRLVSSSTRFCHFILQVLSSLEFVLFSIIFRIYLGFLVWFLILDLKCGLFSFSTSSLGSSLSFSSRSVSHLFLVRLLPSSNSRDLNVSSSHLSSSPPTLFFPQTFQRHTLPQSTLKTLYILLVHSTHTLILVVSLSTPLRNKPFNGTKPSTEHFLSRTERQVSILAPKFDIAIQNHAFGFSYLNLLNLHY
jgi:hypothetical protein